MTVPLMSPTCLCCLSKHVTQQNTEFFTLSLRAKVLPTAEQCPQPRQAIFRFLTISPRSCKNFIRVHHAARCCVSWKDQSYDTRREPRVCTRKAQEPHKHHTLPRSDSCRRLLRASCAPSSLWIRYRRSELIQYGQHTTTIAKVRRRCATPRPSQSPTPSLCALQNLPPFHCFPWLASPSLLLWCQPTLDNERLATHNRGLLQFFRQQQQER
mmetsp:Transcript_15788/g.43584  ORF Transcript_15788/g.43584 Transcript_15788/m.43584 type:complete len:212 (-) Transcript_15788:99-734(-)